MTAKVWGDLASLPSELVCLGFDYGFSSTGVAVGQSITCSATPLAALSMNRYRPNWQQLEGLIHQWQPQLCIVGLPLDGTGKTQKITGHAEKFAHQLFVKFAKVVVMVDERYSTLAARDAVFSEHGYRGLSKEKIDSYAAKLLIEQWFDQH